MSKSDLEQLWQRIASGQMIENDIVEPAAADRVQCPYLPVRASVCVDLVGAELQIPIVSIASAVKVLLSGQYAHYSLAS